MNFRAYCPECKRWVSDDITETATGGVQNGHEHNIHLFLDKGFLKPNEAMEGIKELTPGAYMAEVSKVDADLIVTKILERYKVPIPPNMLKVVVEEALRVMRQLAVEDTRKRRKARKNNDE